MAFLRPSQSVKAPEGREPKMHPREKSAVIHPCWSATHFGSDLSPVC